LRFKGDRRRDLRGGPGFIGGDADGRDTNSPILEGPSLLGVEMPPDIDGFSPLLSDRELIGVVHGGRICCRSLHVPPFERVSGTKEIHVVQAVAQVT